MLTRGSNNPMLESLRGEFMIPVRKIEVGSKWRLKKNVEFIVTVTDYLFDTGEVVFHYEGGSTYKETREYFLNTFFEKDNFPFNLIRKKMTREEMSKVMDVVIIQMQEMRKEGQKEYAITEDNAFANFERVADRCKVSRETALMVYLEKHIDGIHAYIDGHTSQREDVRGRIVDAIVYLTLLYGMVEENQIPNPI